MPPKLKDLQQQCKDAELDQTGKVSELVQRLKDNQNRMKTSPADSEDPTCDAILVTQAMIGAEDDIKSDAHDPFEQTLEEEELEVREVIGELYVGNSRGLGLAGLPERVRILEEEITGLKAKFAMEEAKVAEQEAKITKLQDYVSILRLAGPDYQRVRNRFISVFKREKMRERLQQSDRDFIAAGNVVAHSGDAVIDALLYEGTEGRRDYFVFEELYGLHPSEVNTITHKETIEILNLHARVKANDLPRADEFYQRFRVFIAAFRREDHARDFLQEGPTNATCAAYWSVREVQV